MWIKNSLKEINRYRKITYSKLNWTIWKNTFLSKIIIASWFSFVLLKSTYFKHLFVYNQADVYNSLIIIGIITFLLYFLLESILNIIKKI